MIIRGSSMFQFSVSKDMKKGYKKGCGSREGSGIIISNTNHQGIEN